MDPLCCVRIERRSMSEIVHFGKHLRRELVEPHVDSARTRLNRLFIGSSDPVADLSAMKDRIGLIKRKWINAKPCEAVDFLFSASPEFFRPNGEGPGRWCNERVREFAGAVRRFCDRFLSGRVVSLRIDLDEETPHMHALVLPWVERITKTGKKLVESSYQRFIIHGRGRGSFSWWQDRFAEVCAPIGLARGERGSKTAHKRPSKYKAEMHNELEELRAEVARLRAFEKQMQEEKKASRVKDDAVEAAVAAFGFAEGKRDQNQSQRVKH